MFAITMLIASVLVFPFALDGVIAYVRGGV